MRELLLHYFNIAFLMGKPQDLPVGVHQMRVGIVLAIATYMLALLVPYGIGRAFLQAVIDLVCTGLVLFVCLVLVQRRARFEQAFGGLCGASAFINLTALPLYNLRADRVESSGASLTALADFVLLVWGLSLLAHVIRHTFEFRMVVSVLISFIYFIVLSSLIAAIMPAPRAAVSSSHGNNAVSHFFESGPNDRIDADRECYDLVLV